MIKEGQIENLLIGDWILCPVFDPPPSLFQVFNAVGCLLILMRRTDARWIEDIYQGLKDHCLRNRYLAPLVICTLSLKILWFGAA